MTRPGGLWVADGRARSLRADCEASLEALGGLGIDLYLIHAPDPRVPWRTTVRALARLADEGLVRRVGVSNVNLAQLDEALALAPIAAVENALSPFDDSVLRSGVLARCEERGLALIAHSPLGGPRRARRLPAAEAALAGLLASSPCVVAIPGARTPETARSAVAAAALELKPVARERRRATAGEGEVVMVMGIPGAGKSRLARSLADAGYVRLNRDERGGTLKALAEELDRELAAGARRVVLDNTYLSRVERSRVVDAAARYSARVRCLWLDTPPAQAQVNLVRRVLERFGELPSPEELRRASRREPGILTPTSQLRAVRELEEPSGDEGFAELERVPFVRECESRRRRCARRGRPTRRAGLGGAARRARARAAAPPLRLAARRRRRRPRGGCGAAAGGRRRSGRALGLRAPGRAAGLLVPATAPRPAARLRAPPRGRALAVVPRRDERGPPHARRDAGRSDRELEQRFDEPVDSREERRVIGLELVHVAARVLRDHAPLQLGRDRLVVRGQDVRARDRGEDRLVDGNRRCERRNRLRPPPLDRPRDRLLVATVVDRFSRRLGRQVTRPVGRPAERDSPGSGRPSPRAAG